MLWEFISKIILNLDKHFKTFWKKNFKVIIEEISKFAKTILVIISLYILRKSNVNRFKNKRLKKISLLNKLNLKVTILKMFKTNVNILQIATLNKLRTRYKNAKIVKITNNIYRLTLYCFRIYFTFSTLTKIVLNNNSKLIEEKF